MKMKSLKLKDGDTRKMRNLYAKNGYGLDCSQMMKLINDHQKAKEVGNDYKCALIEYRLTDINFHLQVALLRIGKYDELRQEVKQW